MTSCNDCGHSKNKDCQWDYLYGDTDYAYDCCDFYRVNESDISEFFTRAYKDQCPNITDEQVITEYNNFVNHINRLALEYINSPYYKDDRPN